jgi:hypothetical protein
MKQKKPFWGSSQNPIGIGAPLLAPLLATLLGGLLVFGGYTLNFRWVQPQGGFLNFVLSPPQRFRD